MHYLKSHTIFRDSELLAERYQKVVLQTVKQPSSPVSSGVLLGTVLDHFLFLIFTNDGCILYNVVSQALEVILVTQIASDLR